MAACGKDVPPSGSAALHAVLQSVEQGQSDGSMRLAAGLPPSRTGRNKCHLHT